MEKYAPNKMELASRDVVSRAEQTEINEGRGFPDGTVALDITVVPRKRIHEALREIVNVGRDFAGVDITKEPIHIKPGNHYIMGGVKTDVDGQTEVPGLYAAGECACVSVHGGNRLGANSLLDTLVFGRRSGAHAAARAREVVLNPPSEALLDDEQRRIAELIRREQGGGRRRMSRAAQRAGRDDGQATCAVFRDESGLNTALEVVKRLQGGVQGRRDRRPRHDLQPGRARRRSSSGYMLDCAEATVIWRDPPHREPRRPVPHRLPGAQRRGVAEAHQPHARRPMASPHISYSPVTITQWQPKERQY